MTLRIAMWSGPRNLSTAMMRSFGNRADTFVSDEPYYGAFLKTSGAPIRCATEVIAAMDCDWASVARTLAGPAPGGRPIWYQKHMWHHMVGPVGYDDFAGFTHAFLIRDPARMIASYLRKREAAAFEDFGLDRQAEFFEREADRLGEAPPVVDANDVLADPEGDARRAVRARSAFPGIRRCCAGRRAAAPPTAPGRRTGTRRSRPRPASARPIRPPRSTATRRGSPSAAGLITSGSPRTGSPLNSPERRRQGRRRAAGTRGNRAACRSGPSGWSGCA